MFTIMASIRVRPEHRDTLVQLLVGDASTSFKDEPDWLRFDILQDDSDPNLIHVYEVFRDRAVHAAHQDTPDFKRWLEASKKLSLEVVSHASCTSIFPADDDWE